jgi:hypothetical protein
MERLLVDNEKEKKNGERRILRKGGLTKSDDDAPNPTLLYFIVVVRP